jgi:riboflavin kinase/FMN adenylyltransferase
LHGIFFVEVFGLEREPLPAVASLGTRPTVGGTHMLLEVHLLDFDADIYGRHVNVNFLHKRRDEQRFASLEELKEWIRRDIAAARDYFAERHAGERLPTRTASEERL